MWFPCGVLFRCCGVCFIIIGVVVVLCCCCFCVVVGMCFVSLMCVLAVYSFCG